MSLDLQAERLYDHIELVRGAGRRKRGQLCIMSFVAYLAGERHTDHPRTASPFLRNFAIQLNDGVPSELRRDLKPFAPRIVGSNDGRDFERAGIALQAVMEELLPRASRDFLEGRSRAAFELGNKSLLSIGPSWNDGEPLESIGARFRGVRDAAERREWLAMATRVGQLFTALVQCAPSPAAQRWYWARALDLLDRFCDVGADRRAAMSEGPAPMPASKLDEPSHDRRPLGRLSRALRAALDFVSA
ncbi:MAG TPA: hypothetical protein VMU06_01795 [Stellaceae bacterium]|nr:hypothetical protein [Stellaceae bacterium]